MSENSHLEPTALRCGILVIGSLYWKDDKHGIRDSWRTSRLDLSDKRHVRAPIRYGRRSAGWGHTFTMIFDSATDPGQAILIPCRKAVATLNDLLQEASWLWAAEDQSQPSARFQKQWGCVGAMFSAKANEHGIQDAWARHFEGVRPPAPPPIDGKGRLQIPWLRTPEGAGVEDLDIILATATMPDPKDTRPKATTVAAAWIGQDAGHERYFFENVRHGIRTEDDQEIWRCIEEQQPAWISQHAHTEVVAQLRLEATSR